jgi:ribosomal 50S subunit-recycling heat shock protein
MRVDQVLNKLCLIKTRSIAKKACDADLVKINGKIAKSSSKVIEDDVIEYCVFGNYYKIVIREIPKGNVAKTKAPEFYSLLEKYKEDPVNLDSKK